MVTPSSNFASDVAPKQQTLSMDTDDADDPPSRVTTSAILRHTPSRAPVADDAVAVATPVFSEKPAVKARAAALLAPILAKLRAHFVPVHPLGPPPTYAASFKAVLRYSPLNVCLVFIPIAWAMHYTHQSATLIFVFCCLGIIPLAALLGLGTEQIALRTSHSVGGLLNATLGNIVEMIIAGIALKECKLELVQSSLLGGLLSNMLLVLGMAFIVGGFRFHSQEFQPMVAQLNSSLMTVSVISLIVPAAFHEYLGDRLDEGEEVPVLLQLSRGSAIILILIYIAYLFFQFYSHSHLFLSTEKSPRSSLTSTRSDTFLPVHTSPSPSPSSEFGEIEHPKLNTPAALLVLVATTGLAYLTAEHLVAALEGLVAAHPGVSEKWLTLVVIPVVSNAAEHVTAVVVARKGKFDLAMSVAIGSCIQIALFVVPVLILVAWGMGKPLTLLFDSLETLVLFLSVLLIKFAVEDGRAHWMSGVALIAVYALIALSFWNFPDTVRMVQGQALLCT
ncbi:Sodium/calcium exchanger protein-domain-containing protein [Mycena latifolia]|nr:Sodium/calcium exchanger protein-domain-containing protein [Mycena latifolia]